MLISRGLIASEGTGFLPRTLDEIGAYRVQGAEALRSRIVLHDIALLHKDFPKLKDVPRALRKSYLTQFALISDAQRALEGRLFSKIKDEDRFHFRSALQHGFLAGRSGTTSFLDGLIDLKGVGRAPFSDNGNHRWALYDQIFETLSQPTPENFKLGLERSSEYLLKTLFQLIHFQTEARESFEDKRMADLAVKKMEFEKQVIIEIIDFFKAGYHSFDEAQRDLLVKKLRSFDYFNGLMPLDRAIKEYVVQKLLQRVFDFINSSLGVEYYRTNQIYFVLELPFTILSSGQPAAILGRQASLRRHSDKSSLKIPTSIASPGLGGWQHDAFGAVIDFELVELVLDGLPSEFRYFDKETAYHPLDQKMRELSTEWQQGNYRAIDDYLAKTLRNLSRWMKKSFLVPADNEFYVDSKLINKFREIVQNLESDSAQIDIEEIEAFLQILVSQEETQGLGGLLLAKVNKHFPIFVSKFIIEYLEKTSSDDVNFQMLFHVLSLSHMSQAFIYYADPIRVLLSKSRDMIYADLIRELFIQKTFLDDDLIKLSGEDLNNLQLTLERGALNKTLKIRMMMLLLDELLDQLMDWTAYDLFYYVPPEEEDEYWKETVSLISKLHKIDRTIMTGFFPLYLEHLKRGGSPVDVKFVRSMLSNERSAELDSIQIGCAERLKLIVQGAD